MPIQSRLLTPLVLALLLAPVATAQLETQVSVAVDDDVEASATVTSGGTGAATDAEEDVSADAAADIHVALQAMAKTYVAQDHGLSAAAEARLWEKAEREGRYGRFQAEGDRHDGHFVALQVASDAILDYGIASDANATVFFDAIGLGPIEASQTAGARSHAWFDGGHVQATDDESGSLHITASRPLDIQMDLGADAAARQESPQLVWLEAGGRVAALALLGEGSLSVHGASLAIHLGPGSILRFEAHSGDERAWRQEQASFAAGLLGAQVSIIADARDHISLADEYTVNISRVQARPGSVSFTVDSVAHHARDVQVDLDAGLFASPDDVEMRFDGEAARRVDAAAPRSANASATYSIVEVEGALRAVVHVPGFSAHDIEFASASQGSEAPAGEDAPGPGLLPLLLGAVVLARRLRGS